MASPGNQHCANCVGTLSFPVECDMRIFNVRSKTGGYYSQRDLYSRKYKATVNIRHRPGLVMPLVSQYERTPRCQILVRPS